MLQGVLLPCQELMTHRQTLLVNNCLTLIVKLRFTLTRVGYNFIAKPLNKGGGSFANFAYSVIPELSCHFRPMVRKGKSLLFGHISRIFKKTAAVPPLPPKIAICRQFFFQKKFLKFCI